MKRRVVVTGLGIVSPLGHNIDRVWERLINGESGICKIDRFDVSDLPAKIAGLVKEGDGQDMLNVGEYLPEKETRRMDKFIVFGLIAAEKAIEDSGLAPKTQEELDRIGVLIGSGIGGLPIIEKNSILLNESGPRKISPFFIPASLINLVSGQVAIKYGYTGPNHAVVTACSTGAHAIGDAARLIEYGDADVMIAGGTESAISRIGIAGFCAAKALSTNFNDTPEEASRPWDKDRDGFVMGEGAAIVVLEEYEHAKKRGAKIYAEIKGYGLTGDASHITAPHPEGRGGARAMKRAMEVGGIKPNQIDYINAHGTSTPLGDEIEVKGVKSVFGEHAYKLSISSTKSAIGHLLGAAGSVEAIFSILAIHNQIAPPTLNLNNPSEGCDLDFVPHKGKERKIDYVISNSFGFGGTNASLLIGKI